MAYTPYSTATYRSVKDGPSSAKGSENNGGQCQVETAQYESGIPVHEDGKVRVVVKQNSAVAKVSAASGAEYPNAGVVVPHDDRPGKFMENLMGKP